MDSLLAQGADAVSAMRWIYARLVSQCDAEGGHDLLIVERNFREATRRLILTGCLRELEIRVRDMERDQGIGGHGEKLRGMVRSGVDLSQEVRTCWLATGRPPTEFKSRLVRQRFHKKTEEFLLRRIGASTEDKKTGRAPCERQQHAFSDRWDVCGAVAIRSGQ